MLIKVKRLFDRGCLHIVESGKTLAVSRKQGTERNCVAVRSVFSCVLICAICLLCVLWLSGCTEIKVTNPLGQNVLIEVNDTQCSVGTGVLRLLEAKEDYSSSDDQLLWSRTLGDTTLSEYVKEAVTDELMRYTSSEAMAPDLTVYISEEDRTQVEIDAQALYTSLNSKYNLGRYSITMDDAVDLLLKRTYYNKVFDKLSEDINMEISEAETKAIEISYVLIPSEAGIETAEKLRDTVRGGQSFASVCETMGFEAVLNETVTRGNMPAVFEDKAFVLRDNEVSEIIETRDGYYVIYCIEDYKVAESIANKNRILADAKKAHFEEAYQEFAASARMRFNDKEWDKYDISLMEQQ